MGGAVAVWLASAAVARLLPDCAPAGSHLYSRPFPRTVRQLRVGSTSRLIRLMAQCPDFAPVPVSASGAVKGFTPSLLYLIIA
ncbi:MAG: hypothetical protein WBA57_14215 [Elainellaceae cyanobacterium]